MNEHYRVLIHCNDEKGLVYKVSSIFFHRNLNIISNNEFVDKAHNKFFMRSVVAGEIAPDVLRSELKAILPVNAHLEVIAPRKKRVVLMATKESHALGDILIRYEAGELDCHIVGVVSNYDLLEPLVSKFDIPFYTVHMKDATVMNMKNVFSHSSQNLVRSIIWYWQNTCVF